MAKTESTAEQPGGRPTEVVRIWRQPAHTRLLFMHGVTTTYSFDPTGEYVVGVIARAPLVASRGRERHTLRPGDLGVWEPGRAHAGSPIDGQTWECRLIVIESPDLADLASDPEGPVRDLTFPDPVLRDGHLAASFLGMHRAMDRPASALEREDRLALFLQHLAARSPAVGRDRQRRRASRDDVALRRACEYLAENVTADVSLDMLAQAAETSKFRLVRLFRSALGAPPHALQIAQRVELARRLLEQGAGPAQAAQESGFFDQSHLHRHFRRLTGMSPGRYVLAFATPRERLSALTRPDRADRPTR